MAQAAIKTCKICMRAPGLHYCTQCDQMFCDDCKMSHLRSKISRNHIFMTGTNINMEKKVGCTDHDEDLIYLCEDCNQLICRLCVTRAHKKHAVVDVKDSNKDIQAEISKYLDSKVDNVRSSGNVNFSDVAKLFGNLTFQETEETGKKVKLSAEPKQRKKKDQPPITRSTAVKQYRYKCDPCGRERLSEKRPKTKKNPNYGVSYGFNRVFPGGRYYYGAKMDCANCGKRTWHDEE